MMTRALVIGAMLALLAGCGSVPSYYSSRTSGEPARVASPVVDVDSEPATPRKRITRRARPVAVPAADAVASATAPSAAAVESGNTGTAQAHPQAAATAAQKPWETEEAKARAARRELAIKRTINSICSGC